MNGRAADDPGFRSGGRPSIAIAVEGRLALADAAAVFVVWAALFVAFRQWETVVAALGAAYVGSFTVVVVFWRVRRAYGKGVVTMRSAGTEGLVWGAVLAIVLQLVLWGEWLSRGGRWTAELASGGALLALLEGATLSGCAGALVAIVLWTGNRLVLGRPGPRLRNESTTR